jgi:hypothetical protein
MKNLRQNPFTTKTPRHQVRQKEKEKLVFGEDEKHVNPRNKILVSLVSWCLGGEIDLETFCSVHVGVS